MVGCRATIQAALHVGHNLNYSGGVTACMNPHMHPKEQKSFKPFETEYSKSISRGQTIFETNRLWHEEYKDAQKLEVRYLLVDEQLYLHTAKATETFSPNGLRALSNL